MSARMKSKASFWVRSKSLKEQPLNAGLATSTKSEPAYDVPVGDYPLAHM
jgi:hypothetical protein